MTNPMLLVVYYFPVLACMYVLLVYVDKQLGFFFSMSIEMT